MAFGTYSFALLFVILLVVYFLLPRWPQRRAVILVFSYLFYAAARPSYLLVLVACTVVAWLVARWLSSLPVGSRQRRGVFVLGLVAVAGALLTLKYGGFFLRNVKQAAEWVGLRMAGPPAWRFVPLGISFFTFEAISYLVDVYRGTTKPARRFTDVALYLSFFPNLTAGPIMRAGALIPQFATPRTVGWREINLGFLLIVWGLFKKSVIADNLVVLVDRVFGTGGTVPMMDAWTGTFAYSIQIYCDFSGYSDMAIGLALLLGFQLVTNFRAPYGVVGFRAFWQRWHISLSTWLRDYIFTPMALRRPTFGWMLVAAFITMLVCGLWHGATWTFVIWGGLHGAFLVLERLWLKATSRRFRRRLNRRARFAGVALTFVLASVAWVFFRAPSVAGAWDILKSMAGLGGGGDLLGAKARLAILAISGAVVAGHVVEQRVSFVERVARGPAWRHVLVVLALLAGLALASVPAEQFIYFEF